MVLILLVSILGSSLTAQKLETKKDVPDIAAEALKATVLVIVYDQTGKPLRTGSGFVVSPDGKVLTNYHVVQGGAVAAVKFTDGAYYQVEGLVAADPAKDIAVLKIKSSGIVFSTLPLGDSEQVRLGERVIAVGSPLLVTVESAEPGLTSEATVSDGIISGIRDLQGRSLKMLQTTAPVSHGSSGGPLLNMEGQVIGIVTWSFGDLGAENPRGENLNYATPINYVKVLVNGSTVTPLAQLMVRAGETRSRSGTLADVAGTYLGIWQSPLSGSGALAMTITVDGDRLRAKVVVTGSPVGYKGDLLVSVNLTQMGEGVWTTEFKAEKNSRISLTGIFKLAVRRRRSASRR